MEQQRYVRRLDNEMVTKAQTDEWTQEKKLRVPELWSGGVSRQDEALFLISITSDCPCTYPMAKNKTNLYRIRVILIFSFYLFKRRVFPVRKYVIKEKKERKTWCHDLKVKRNITNKNRVQHFGLGLTSHSTLISSSVIGGPLMTDVIVIVVCDNADINYVLTKPKDY